MTGKNHKEKAMTMNNTYKRTAWLYWDGKAIDARNAGDAEAEAAAIAKRDGGDR